MTFNCIFGGEDYDARLEQPGWDLPGFDDAAWRDVVEQEPPKGTLTPQTAPAIAVCERYGVKEHRKTGPQRHLFDMGQNLSGFPTLKVRGRAGQKVRLVPAEQLSEDSLTVRQATSGSPCWFEYTLRGDSVEEWTPQFAFYGYRYLEAEGVDYLTAGSGGEVPVILDLQSDFVHASAPATGRFECSNALFNRIWFIIDKAMRSNMHAVFTDCPHREKLGWLEETHLNGPGLLFNYDLRGVLPKVMRDIADTQRPDGLIPDIAPEYVVFREGFVDSPEWGSAGAILPWMYYEWYGDDSLIREYYPVMRRYADYLAGRADNYILSYGLGDWCDYGAAARRTFPEYAGGDHRHGSFLLGRRLHGPRRRTRGRQGGRGEIHGPRPEYCRGLQHAALHTRNRPIRQRQSVFQCHSALSGNCPCRVPAGRGRQSGPCGG